MRRGAENLFLKSKRYGKDTPHRPSRSPESTLRTASTLPSQAFSPQGRRVVALPGEVPPLPGPPEERPRTGRLQRRRGLPGNPGTHPWAGGFETRKKIPAGREELIPGKRRDRGRKSVGVLAAAPPSAST